VGSFPETCNDPNLLTPSRQEDQSLLPTSSVMLPATSNHFDRAAEHFVVCFRSMDMVHAFEVERVQALRFIRKVSIC